MLFKSLAIFGISTLVLQLSSGVVLAVESTTTSTTTANTTKTAEKTIEQRIAERKTLLKTKLDAVTQARIKAKCVAAQKLVVNAKTRSDKAIENRQKAYESVQTRLTALLSALEKNGVDTSSIEELQAQVKVAINKLKTDVTAYSQTITDLSSMDCAADPVGFKATLETARTQRQQVAKDSAALKALKGKIALELAKIKAQNLKTTGEGNQ